MKKIIILSFTSLVLFTATVSPIYASSDNSLLPPWFSSAIKPIQDSISSLFTKADNHEARITELEKKNASLEEKVNGLEKQLSNQNNLLINLFNGEAITIPSEPTGIGATDPTSHLDLNCGSSCQDLLHIP